MKKIILWSLLTFSIFFIVQDIGATGYSGSPTFSIPGVVTNTGLTLFTPHISGSFYSAGQGGSRATFSVPFFSDRYGESAIFGSDFNESFFSGSQTDIALSVVDAGGGNGFCPGSTWGLILGVTKTDKYSFWIQSFTGPGYGGCGGSFVGGQKIVIQTLPLNYSCGPSYTDTKNCIIMVKPFFWNDISVGFNGVYVAYLDMAIYNASGTQSSWIRKHFDGGDYQPVSTWYQTALQYFSSYTSSSLGLQIISGNHYGYLQDPYSGRNTYYFSYPGDIAQNNHTFHFSSNILNLNDDTLSVDYMAGNTGTILQQTTRDWFGYNSIYTSETGTGYTPGTGSISGITSSGSTNYYSSCGSFLDVGCYIKATYDSIVSIFPKITGSGGWFDVTYAIPLNSSGSTNTTCTVIDENLHYQDTTNQSAIHYSSSLAPIQYVFDIVNSIVGLFAVTMKSFVPSSTVCLFGVSSVVPIAPKFQDIGLSNSIFTSSYNTRFGGVSGDLHTGPIQSFFDLFFVFIFTISVLILIRPIFVIEL